MNGNVESQGGLVVQFDGGGERKGIVGMVAGMVGIEGIVVGMVGNGVFDSGGSVNVGRVVGWDGSVGNGGRVGNGVLGRGGNVAVGRVGKEGRGGNVGLGSDGIVGSVDAAGGAAGVSNKWRAARLTLLLASDNATTKDKKKQKWS
jgi:hypothetical protein